MSETPVTKRLKASSEAPIFQVYLVGHGSHVLMNGKELKFVRDVKVHQPLEGPTTVTIEFLASAVNGIQKP